MRRLDTAYRIVRLAVLGACAGKPPSAWEPAVTAALRDLKKQGLLNSWTLNINARLRGLVLRLSAPGLPSAVVSIIPASSSTYIII